MMELISTYEVIIPIKEEIHHQVKKLIGKREKSSG
jgi:hypothetical protein